MQTIQHLNNDMQINDHLTSILGGHIFFQTLNVGAKLDLFTLLDNLGALSKEQIEKQLKLKSRSARILLLGLTTLKLISKNDDYYENTPLATKFLSKNSSKNILSIIEWQSEINYNALSHYYEATLSGDNEGLVEFEGMESNLYQRLSHNPILENIFQKAMHELSNQANQDLLENIDFSEHKTIVDVGGGDGSNLIKILKQSNGLSGYVFDSPTVCAIAQKNFADQGLSSHCRIYEGNCFETPFPTDCDAIIFCHFLTIWTAEKNKALLKKAYESLPENGCVYIFNMMQNDEENGPLTAAMGSPYFLTLATSEGMLYTWQEYKNWLQEASFQIETVKELPLDHGVIKARKLKKIIY